MKRSEKSQGITHALFKENTMFFGLIMHVNDGYSEREKKKTEALVVGDFVFLSSISKTQDTLQLCSIQN